MSLKLISSLIWARQFKQEVSVLQTISAGNATLKKKKKGK